MTKKQNDTYIFADWTFTYSQNALHSSSSNTTSRLEPKVSELLRLLLDANGEVLSREQLISALWPNVIVGDDTLARTVSRLRAELSDSANNPKFIQTIPKKGYRFLVGVKSYSPKKKRLLIPASIVAVFIATISITVLLKMHDKQTNIELDEMLARADSLYMRFEEQSNEAALALYEKALEVDAENAQAQAGVANAMVQRVVRWPSEPFSINESGVSLTAALSSGQLQTPDAVLMLERARLIAEKAVRQSPNDILALKSLGFVYSAEGRIARAIEQYTRAVNIDQNAWRSLINLGELYALNGQDLESLQTFIRAFDAMQAKFDEEPQHIGPWQPELGNIIASRFVALSDEQNVQIWAKKVLELVPFERRASTFLIESLLRENRSTEASRICEDYAMKLSPLEICSEL